MKNMFIPLRAIRRPGLLKALLYGALVFVLYRSALSRLVFKDWGRDDYSHCALIPFVFLYLLWEKRQRLEAAEPSPSWSGFLPLATGIGLFWLGELGGEFFSMYLSLWLVLVGLLWIHLGWRTVRTMGFALLIMPTMFPLPGFLNARLLLELKLASSRLGVALLQAAGVSAHREGNVIDLGITQLQVVDACSGMRYVLPLTVLSLLMAYWYRAGLWKKVTLVATAIPLAILFNSLRIAAAGMLCSLRGPQAAEGFFHAFSGGLIFLFTLPALLLEMRLLNRLAPVAEGPQAVVAREANPGGGPCFRRSSVQPVFVTAVLLLTATLALSRGIQFREEVPLRKPFARFPCELGEWTGQRQAMEARFVEALHPSDYLMLACQNDAGREVFFSVAYYGSQRKGEAVHSPETCLPGSGWEVRASGTASIDGGKGKVMQVRRAVIAKSGTVQLIYFWFPQRGRILTSLCQVKLFAFRDALVRHRTDGALVRVVTPVYESEGVGAAEKRLAGFVQVMNPVLEKYLPR